jgi:hypothetical protein
MLVASVAEGNCAAQPKLGQLIPQCLQYAIRVGGHSRARIHLRQRPDQGIGTFQLLGLVAFCLYRPQALNGCGQLAGNNGQQLLIFAGKGIGLGTFRIYNAKHF